MFSDLQIAFRPHDAQELEDARPDPLSKIEITRSGLGIHFPQIDADIYLRALLEGFSHLLARLLDHLMPMPRASTTAGRCPRGWEWFPDSIPVGENRHYLGKANGVTSTCERCLFMALDRRLLAHSATPRSIPGWLAYCIGAIRT